MAAVENKDSVVGGDDDGFLAVLALAPSVDVAKTSS